MYIPNPYFKNVPEIGDLVLDYIFVENDCPILFTCKSTDSLYLCLCRTNIGVQQWVVSEISIHTLANMIHNRISIYDAFKKDNRKAYIVTWQKGYAKEGYKILRSSEIKDEDLPDEDVFLDDDGEALVYLQKKIEERKGEK